MNLSSGISKLDSVARKLQIPLAAAGFLMGVDYKFMSQSANAGTTYPFNQQGLEDAIASIAGPSVAKQLDPNYSGSAVQTFNPWAAFNQDTIIAAILYMAHDLYPDNKFVKLAYDFGFPLEAGRGLGRIFDDPPHQNSYSSVSGSGALGRSQTGYNAQGNLNRNGLPTAGAPWT